MNILEQIVDHKRDEIASRRQRMSISALTSSEYFTRATRSLHDSLEAQPAYGIIAEIKRASPSSGAITLTLDPSAIAHEYEAHGAAGISVLTDERFFGGSLDDLRKVRVSAALPILRKDFILDEYQLFEAKSAGADAVLLIAAILDRLQLRDLHSAAVELGMETLVEVYEPHEIDKLDLDAMKLVGANNRDLRTFSVDINKSIAIRKLLPTNLTFVSESGIRSVDDLKKLYDNGIHAALIGEYLVKSDRPGTALANLLEGMKRETAR